MTDIEDYKADRSKAWAKIIDAIRDYRLMNMVDEDGENYPLVDLMTSDGRDIGDGESEMVALADDIHAALFEHDQAASRIASLEALVRELVGALASIKELEYAPQYHHQGMGCGVEDRCLQKDGYGAAEYGWDDAAGRYAEWACGIAEDALSHPIVSELTGEKEGGE